MNKKLLLTSLIMCYFSINMVSAQIEQDILEKYKNEFVARNLTSSNRKVVNCVNDMGEKVKCITYRQIQTGNNGGANIKEIVMTKNGNAITDFTFNFGSELFFDGEDYSKHAKYVDGVSAFMVSSQSILNKQGKTIFLKNRYEIFATSPHDKDIFENHLEVELHISHAVYDNIDLIKEKYNQVYVTRSIEELSNLGLHLTTNESGYEETNEVLLKMILKEREAIINNILIDYDSYFKIEYDIFITNPNKIWDQFYIDPIKFITTYCDNSPLLK